VIHVATEGEYSDKDGNNKRKINYNVLIEIGSAMALYGKKVILLVEKGFTLPSNLQELYRCDVDGDKFGLRRHHETAENLQPIPLVLAVRCVPAKGLAKARQTSEYRHAQAEAKACQDKFRSETQAGLKKRLRQLK
jgi:Predicted nucleotide-binding protein containing TIR-like domain